MTAWIMSIVGIVTIGVLLDIVVPEGEMNKYIKGVFSLLTICVIVSPLPKLFGNNANIFENFGNSQTITTDEGLLESIREDRERELAENLSEILQKSDVDVQEIGITLNKNNINRVDSVRVVLLSGNWAAKTADIASAYLGIGTEEVNIIVTG